MRETHSHLEAKQRRQGGGAIDKSGIEIKNILPWPAVHELVAFPAQNPRYNSQKVSKFVSILN